MATIRFNGPVVIEDVDILELRAPHVDFYGVQENRARHFFEKAGIVNLPASPFNPYLLFVTGVDNTSVQVIQTARRADVLCYDDNVQVMIAWPGRVNHTDYFTFTVGELREYVNSLPRY